MKEFKRVVAPKVECPEDQRLQEQINRALGELARNTNDAIASLVRNTIQDFPVWATGERHTINCKDLNQDGIVTTIDDEIVVRHGLGVVPSGCVLYNVLPRPTAGGINNVAHTLMRSPDTTWTTTHAYFRATTGAFTDGVEFKILLLP